MSSISINGVMIEYAGAQWRAYFDGVCSRGHTPMLAYLAYLKAEADQAADDLMTEYFNVKADLVKMWQVKP